VKRRIMTAVRLVMVKEQEYRIEPVSRNNPTQVRRDLVTNEKNARLRNIEGF
jgi:hypothetical protein